MVLVTDGGANNTLSVRTRTANLSFPSKIRVHLPWLVAEWRSFPLKTREQIVGAAIHVSRAWRVRDDRHCLRVTGFDHDTSNQLEQKAD
jgi:hypothetical protein